MAEKRAPDLSIFTRPVRFSVLILPGVPLTQSSIAEVCEAVRGKYREKVTQPPGQRSNLMGFVGQTMVVHLKCIQCKCHQAVTFGNISVP